MKLQRYTTSHGTMCDSAEVADLEKAYTDVLQTLCELYLLVKNKGQNILDEDARNNGFLEVKIIAAIYAEEAK